MVELGNAKIGVTSNTCNSSNEVKTGYSNICHECDLISSKEVKQIVIFETNI